MLDYRRKSSIFANTNLNKNVMNKKTLKAFLLTFCILLNQRVVLSQVRSEPGRYDILITEIMAKPAPEVGLPPVEYLELHSRLPYPVTMQNWRLTLGNTNKSLPNITLDSCGYAVLIAQKWLEDFASVCENVYILSSLAITDGGQALTLHNKNGEVMHYVHFRPTWHTEKIKQEGGWSLEMIDEGWPCAGGWNWNSSVDPLGGTPGRPNSIRNSLYDNTEPHITGVTLRDSVTLRVHFSKTLAQETKNPVEFFRAEPYLKVLTVNEVQPDFASWDIRFSEAVEPSTVYRLLAAGEVSDCGGTRWEISEAVPFGRASPPEHNDLVINEILTNALGDENADYLEIYNRSNKIIDLKDVKVGYGGDTLPQKAVFALSKGFQLLPGTYLALCKRRNLTLEQYICRDEKALADCDSLPDFAATKGIIYLTDRSLRTIDRLAYTEEMHYPKLLTVKGVSLERLYPDMPTQDENNWRSAAESAGFGTPGYRNSQAGNALESSGFEIIPDVFSPDNDGFDDYTEVICTFPNEENRVNIVLYNNRGYPVKRLANNILCGSEARFRWDGTDDNNQPAPAGMYAVQIECWNLRTQKTLRKRLVAAIYR